MNTLEQDIQLAKAGNQEAFGRLYNETVKIAYYVAKRVLVNENEEAVEDVLQESYIAVFKNLDKYTSGNFQGWVDTIVANRCKNYLRKKNPLLFSQLADEDGKEMEFEEENLEFRPDAKTDYEETKRLVLEIIDNLPEEQRLSVILFYYEQLSVKEIAKVCECSENTIKSRLNYGRKAIKEEVLKLEKKGTKLYCAPLLPFLFWLYSQEAKACEMPKGMLSAEKVLETAMAEGTAGGSAVAGGASASGSATAGMSTSGSVATGSAAGNGAIASGMVNGAATGGALAVKTAGLSMAAKIVIGIAAVAVVTGTAVGIVAFTNANKNAEQTVQEEVENSEEDLLEEETTQENTTQEITLEEEQQSEESQLPENEEQETQQEEIPEETVIPETQPQEEETIQEDSTQENTSEENTQSQEPVIQETQPQENTTEESTPEENTQSQEPVTQEEQPQENTTQESTPEENTQSQETEEEIEEPEWDMDEEWGDMEITDIEVSE